MNNYEYTHGLSRSLLENMSPFNSVFTKTVINAETPVLYGATLVCQTRICSEIIIEHLKNFPHWKAFKKILEVGCGPGLFAENLVRSSLLEGKTYTGIDLEKYFIEKACTAKLGDNVNFVCKSVYDFDEKDFDAALLIAVLQHLGDLDAVLPTVLRLVKKKRMFVSYFL